MNRAFSDQHLHKIHLPLGALLVCVLLSACQGWGEFWKTASALGLPLTAGSYRLADTGQLMCASAPTGDGAYGPCPQSVTGQDGDYPNTPMARSFTGPTPHAIYTSDNTTRDNLTGLVWKSCSEGLSGVACESGLASTPTWTAAASACSALNTANAGAGYAGVAAWRLPAVYELRSLTNFGVVAPAIDAAHFPATQASAGYWTATAYAPSPGTEAWIINPGTGVIASALHGGAYYVRCVSGVSAVVSFTDHGDGTVTDLSTGLRWQKCSRGYANVTACSSGPSVPGFWVPAIGYCQSLTLAGRTWRLPSINELSSLVDYSTNAPAINTAFFPSTALNNYWASTTSNAATTDAWVVNFNIGTTVRDSIPKGAVSADVRCVSNDIFLSLSD